MRVLFAGKFSYDTPFPPYAYMSSSIFPMYRRHLFLLAALLHMPRVPQTNRERATNLPIVELQTSDRS